MGLSKFVWWWTLLFLVAGCQARRLKQVRANNQLILLNFAESLSNFQVYLSTFTTPFKYREDKLAAIQYWFNLFNIYFWGDVPRYTTLILLSPCAYHLFIGIPFSPDQLLKPVIIPSPSICQTWVVWEVSEKVFEMEVSGCVVWRIYSMFCRLLCETIASRAGQQIPVIPAQGRFK